MTPPTFQGEGTGWGLIVEHKPVYFHHLTPIPTFPLDGGRSKQTRCACLNQVARSFFRRSTNR
jgi:hypothetical protein